MSNAVSIFSPPSLPAPLTPAGETLLRRFESALRDSSFNFSRMAIEAADAPSAEARALMQRRLDLVESWLAPADPDEIGCTVSMMSQNLAVQNAGADAVRLAKEGYVATLSRYPFWAIWHAGRRFVDGYIGNRRFMPTTAEMGDEVRRLIDRQVAERARLIRVLDAVVVLDPDPVMAARGLQAVADALSGKGLAGGERERRSAEPLEHARDALLATPLQPGSLSPGAIGRMIPDHPARRVGTTSAA